MEFHTRIRASKAISPKYLKFDFNCCTVSVEQNTSRLGTHCIIGGHTATDYQRPKSIPFGFANGASFQIAVTRIRFDLNAPESTNPP